MRLLLVIFFIVSFCHPLTAQLNPGARQISMANSDVALSNDIFALFNNPAGLSQMYWREAGVYYSPAPYGFTELSNGFAAYHEPFEFGSIAAGGMTYGFDLYRESKFVLGYSYSYMKRFFVGAAVNYHTISIKNYGSDGSFYINVGGLAYLTESIKWGFYVQNVNRASFGNYSDQIPIIFNTGFNYEVLESFNFNFAFEKEINFKTSLRGGIEYFPIDYLALRIGFSNEPNLYSAGIGIIYSFLNFDYAVFTHNDLGLTHQAGIIFSFGVEESRSKRIKKFLNAE